MKRLGILTLFSCITTFSYAHTGVAPKDSIGVENRTDKTVIIHRVEQGQTLYSILKKYKCTLKDYMIENPNSDESIAYDQIVRVPISKKFPRDEYRRLSEADQKAPRAELPVDGIVKKNTTAINNTTKPVLTEEKTVTPEPKHTEPVTHKSETSPVAKTTPSVSNTSIPGGVKTHIVEPKQTLFGIANKYGVTVEDLKNWNNLSSNDVKIGQVLIVSPPKGSPIKWKKQSSTPTALPQPSSKAKSAIKPTTKGKNTTTLVTEPLTTEPQNRKVLVKEETTDEVKKEKPKSQAELLREKEEELKAREEALKAKEAELYEKEKNINKPVVSKKEDKEEIMAKKPKIDSSKQKEVVKKETPKPQAKEDDALQKLKEQTAANTRPMKESGLAGLIDLNGSEKYLALHKTAPVGTVIQVRNEANNRTVQVRVIGRLPDTGLNEKYVIKISPKAFDKLNPVDKKIRAELNYSVPE